MVRSIPSFTLILLLNIKIISICFSGVFDLWRRNFRQSGSICCCHPSHLHCRKMSMLYWRQSCAFTNSMRSRRFATIKKTRPVTCGRSCVASVLVWTNSRWQWRAGDCFITSVYWGFASKLEILRLLTGFFLCRCVILDVYWSAWKKLFALQVSAWRRLFKFSFMLRY